MTEKEILKVLTEATKIISKKDTKIRWGQAFFNVLYNYYPDIANHISSTQYDTFYYNDRVAKCIKYLLTYES